MKCHNQKIRKKQDQSVVIPELTCEDAETKREIFLRMELNLLQKYVIRTDIIMQRQKKS